MLPVNGLPKWTPQEQTMMYECHLVVVAETNVLNLYEDEFK